MWADAVADLLFQLSHSLLRIGNPGGWLAGISAQTQEKRAAVRVGESAYIGHDGIQASTAYGYVFVEILDDIGPFFSGSTNEIKGRLRLEAVGPRAGEVIGQEKFLRSEEHTS